MVVFYKRPDLTDVHGIYCSTVASRKFAPNNSNRKRNKNREFELFLITVLVCANISKNYSDVSKIKATVCPRWQDHPELALVPY